VIPASFQQIFAPELHGRLVWFGRLRWAAAAGLALASLCGPALGFPSVWPGLLVVAGVVSTYNIVFRLIVRRQRLEHDPVRLRAIAVTQIILDLAALLVTVHFTGGLQSPLLPLFAFHMVIGAMLIAARWTYLLAGAVSLGAVVLLTLEARGTLAFHPLVPGSALDIAAARFNLIALVFTMFGIVFLSDSVVRRLKTRSIELYEATDALSERTEELHRLLKEMEDLERRKSHYMHISAHQLRSPLGTIRTVLRVLTQGYVDPGTEPGRKMLNDAVGVADGLLLVVNDLLALAKMREGRKWAPWARSVNLNQLLADLFDTLTTDAEERRVKLVPDFKGVAVLEWGVPPDLVHAFENLIYNGIKYSRSDRSLVVELRTADDSAVVRIIDQGIGIPEEYRDQVFMEFVRAPNAKHHEAEGTGLGLAIVKEVIESHGGTVSVESRTREGSTFTVRLPLRRTPPEAERLLQAGNDSRYSADSHGTASSSD
jgi:signal transduction histidine kinase